MSASMENKEALEQELVVQPAEFAEAPAETAENVVETASEPAPEEAPAENEVPADDSENFRPSDVSEDGSPHGPLDLFGDEDEEKKDEPEEKSYPSYAAFHEPDEYKPGQYDDEEEAAVPAVKKTEEEDDEDDDTEYNRPLVDTPAVGSDEEFAAAGYGINESEEGDTDLFVLDNSDGEPLFENPADDSGSDHDDYGDGDFDM